MGLQTATNPETGDRVVLVGDQWQPITQSATNKDGAKAYLVGGKWLTDDAAPAAVAAPAATASGIPTARKDMGASPYAVAPSNPTLKALYSSSVGFYRGLQDITDTGYIAATEALGIKGAREEASRQKAQYTQQYGDSLGADVGRVGGQVVGTLPIGGVIAEPIKAAAKLTPALAKYLIPVATAIETGGFQTALKPGAANVAARVGGGAVVGGASAAAVNPEDADTGAVIGALVPSVLAPAVKGGVNFIRKLSDLKSSTYLDAVEGMGRDIVNALTSKTATIVPGSAPTAAQVAAPAGSAKFSAFGRNLSELPNAASDYAAASAQSNQARIAQDTRVADRFKKVADKLIAKIDRNLVDVSPTEVGDALIAAAKTEQQAVKANVVRPAYKAAFDAAGDAKIDVSNVVSEAERILDRKLSEFATETAPDTVRKLRGFLPKAPEVAAVTVGKAGFKTAKPPVPARATPEATLQDLDDVRKAINADIAAASSGNTPMAATTIKNLRQLHSAIDDAIGKSTTLADDAKTLYAEAVSKYRTEYAPKFKEGVNANLFKKTSIGEGRVRPEDVIAKYFNPNAESEARQFITLFGNNPDAMKIGRTGIEDIYRKKVAQGGMSHANFMKEYGRTVDIYDNAGMNLRQRFDVIDKDVQRLAKIDEMAKASGNKLAPPLPPGSNALAVEARIADLTKGLDDRKLTAINSVRDDLAREAEYQRLASAGGKGPKSIQSATEAGKESGLAPTASLLNRAVTLYNVVVSKLLGHVDEKLAMELAREMLNPAVAAKSIEKAMARKGQQEATNQLAGRVGTRVAPALSQLSADQNALPPRLEASGMTTDNPTGRFTQ